MLKRIMDLKGKIPKNVIKKGAVWKNHFDDNLDFKFIDKDSMSLGRLGLAWLCNEDR